MPVVTYPQVAMLEGNVNRFVGKTVESVQVIPRDADKSVPFAVVIKFTDGFVLRTVSYEIGGGDPRMGADKAAWFMFPG